MALSEYVVDLNLRIGHHSSKWAILGIPWYTSIYHFQMSLIVLQYYKSHDLPLSPLRNLQQPAPCARKRPITSPVRLMVCITDSTNCLNDRMNFMTCARSWEVTVISPASRNAGRKPTKLTKLTIYTI